MTGLLLALVAAYGVYLLYTRLAFGWEGLGVAPTPVGEMPRRDRVHELMVQAGVDDVRPVELAAVVSVLFAIGGGFAFLVFGGPLPAFVAGTFAASVPMSAAATRRSRRLDQAREAWPRMIEEIRLQATTVGRSIPQALFEVGARCPEELRPAFAAAHREWMVSTDFERTIAVLKARLADPTADAVCETLLIAHDVGGTDVEQRLESLIEDRIQDLQGRKDARAKQAGVRFARAFVLLVPAGMALIGLSIGEGRAAYQTDGGQLAVVIGLLLMVLCWLWASRLLRLPEEDRVFFS